MRTTAEGDGFMFFVNERYFAVNEQLPPKYEENSMARVAKNAKSL